MSDYTLRIMYYNYADRDDGEYEVSSEVSDYPFTNTQNAIRAQYFSFAGFFEITSTNKKIYINDGSDKTAEITIGSYSTPASLAIAIQTALNTVSSNFTCTYSTTLYKFTISRLSSFTLRMSETTHAAWDTLGFNLGVDVSGTTFTSYSQRNHSYEYIRYDLTAFREVRFIAITPPVEEILSISSSAIIKLEANNIDDFDDPPYSRTLTHSDDGIFEFLDEDDTTYRFWRIYIEDQYNPLGNEGIKISHIYLGDYLGFEDRTVAHGYNLELIDPTTMSASESGVEYFDVKTKYFQLSNLQLNVLKRDQKDELLLFLRSIGLSTPFYISVDPTLTYTDYVSDLTKFVYLNGMPQLSHTMRDMFSVTLNFKEVR